MAKSLGLVIRAYFGKYVVCDGVDPSHPDEFTTGQIFSPEFDTHEEAMAWRRRLYDVVSNELQEAANEFDNKAYEETSKYLDAKYDI